MRARHSPESLILFINETARRREGKNGGNRGEPGPMASSLFLHPSRQPGPAETVDFNPRWEGFLASVSPPLPSVGNSKKAGADKAPAPHRLPLKGRNLRRSYPEGLATAILNSANLLRVGAKAASALRRRFHSPPTQSLLAGASINVALRRSTLPAKQRTTGLDCKALQVVHIRRDWWRNREPLLDNFPHRDHAS